MKSINNKGKAFCISSELPITNLGGGISRQILSHDDQIMMVKVMFEKDAVGYQHNHPHRQVSYVASGEFEVTIDDVKKVLKKGDAFYAAPHLNHGVLCTQSGTLIDIFNPTRLDFLE